MRYWPDANTGGGLFVPGYGAVASSDSIPPLQAEHGRVREAGDGVRRFLPARLLVRLWFAPLLPQAFRDSRRHERHHGYARLHTVQLEPAVEALRDAGRQLNDGFLALGPHRSLSHLESTGKLSAVQWGAGRRETGPARTFDPFGDRYVTTTT